MNELIPAETIQQRIFIVRGKRVLLDVDLARFYGVGTPELNRAVTRNPDRFPEDFAFQLTRDEARNLMFQFGTSRAEAAESKRNEADPKTVADIARSCLAREVTASLSAAAT
jgi:hypothetical protein